MCFGDFNPVYWMGANICQDLLGNSMTAELRLFLFMSICRFDDQVI
ncbi:unnamed protein product [Callosobruchus maculatus]|uniref:Uncharacterized protein n=1 Tax=Callosobruchus maculatus TaxID=64391 RepID=A0A653DKB6_CALMS|nr:unnamed protein product [Callosobruchus maculatus]